MEKAYSDIFSVLVVSSSLDCFKKEMLSSVGLSGADCDTIVHNFWSENVGFFAVKLRLFQIHLSHVQRTDSTAALLHWYTFPEILREQNILLPKDLNP